MNYFTIGILTASLLFPLAQDARAFYNAQSGCWPSRDPLGDAAFVREQTKNKPGSIQKRLSEEAKLPSYMFVRNDPIGVIDCVGLKTLSVALCEVIVFYGHGIQGEPYDFDWAGPCSAAAFIGCWDAETDNKITSKFNQIPGVPTTDDEMAATDLDKYFTQAWNAAGIKAIRMCKKCGCVCPIITIKAVQVPGNPLDTGWITDEHYYHPDEPIKCR